MSNLYRRNGHILKVNSVDSTRPDFAQGYDVTAYALGAITNGIQIGASAIMVHEGHGFVADEFLMVRTDPTLFRKVASVTATHLTLDSGPLSVGDDWELLNLGTDSGTTSPHYDGSTVTIYRDSNADTFITNSRVTADSVGKYDYWVNRTTVWELIRDGDGTPVELVVDAVCFGRVIRANPLPTLKSHETTMGVLAGGSGVPDQNWLWMKKEDDSWGWVGPLHVAP